MLEHIEDVWAAAIYHWTAVRPLVPMYIHLILSALFPIYTGAHASLTRPASAAKKQKEEGDDDTHDDAEEEISQRMEGLKASDAIIFPITAAITLAGLYYLITKYGASIINYFLGWYFAAVGVFSVGKLLNDAANVFISFIFPNYFRSSGKLFVIQQPKQRVACLDKPGSGVGQSPSPLWPFRTILVSSIWSVRTMLKQKYAVKIFVRDAVDLKGSMTIVNFTAALVSFASIVYANTAGKPWWLTNLQGFGVCYSALQFMSPTTFATGSLILGALFFYDIWAVFFTPLMVTVATNLDQPIKLVFPKPDEPSLVEGEPPVKSYSMLGLGDIVLPGLMIGLALRFDLYMFYLKKQTKITRAISADSTNEAGVQKATYIPVTGKWGDIFWTAGLWRKKVPEQLQTRFGKPYFTAAMVGYVAGMLATLAIMTVFQHAQPALLYLVPGVLISIWTTGLVRGELKEMWNYTEALTGESLDEDGTKNETQPPHDHTADVDPQKSEPEQSWLRWLWHSITGSEAEVKSSSTSVEAPVDKGESTILPEDNEQLILISIKRLPTRPPSETKKVSKLVDNAETEAETAPTVA